MPDSSGASLSANDATVKLGGPAADTKAEAVYFVERCTASVEKQRSRLADAEKELEAAQAVLNSIEGATDGLVS